MTVLECKFYRQNQFLAANNRQEFLILLHNWEPCQADHAAQPLLYQHLKSLVLLHKMRANKMAETEPRYKINIQE